MRACLRMTSNMARVYNNTQMELSKRAYLKKERRMVTVYNNK